MSTPISLGMPQAPVPILAPRRPTRKIRVGKVEVGGALGVFDAAEALTPEQLQRVAQAVLEGVGGERKP